MNKLNLQQQYQPMLVKIYFRTYNKKASPLTIQKTCSYFNIYDLVKKKFNINDNNLLLIHQGQILTHQSKLNFNQKDIVHVVDLMNVNKLEISFTIKLLKQNRSQKFLAKTSDIIRQFIKLKFYTKFNSNINPVLVYTGRQLDFEKTFLEQYIEDGCEIICIQNQNSSIVSLSLSPIRNEICKNYKLIGQKSNQQQQKLKYQNKQKIIKQSHELEQVKGQKYQYNGQLQQKKVNQSVQIHTIDISEQRIYAYANDAKVKLIWGDKLDLLNAQIDNNQNNNDFNMYLSPINQNIQPPAVKYNEPNAKNAPIPINNAFIISHNQNIFSMGNAELQDMNNTTQFNDRLHKQQIHQNKLQSVEFKLNQSQQQYAQHQTSQQDKAVQIINHQRCLIDQILPNQNMKNYQNIKNSRYLQLQTQNIQISIKPYVKLLEQKNSIEQNELNQYLNLQKTKKNQQYEILLSQQNILIWQNNIQSQHNQNNSLKQQKNQQDQYIQLQQDLLQGYIDMTNDINKNEINQMTKLQYKNDKIQNKLQLGDLIYIKQDLNCDQYTIRTQIMNQLSYKIQSILMIDQSEIQINN